MNFENIEFFDKPLPALAPNATQEQYFDFLILMSERIHNMIRVARLIGPKSGIALDRVCEMGIRYLQEAKAVIASAPRPDYNSDFEVFSKSVALIPLE